ncbi:MAG: flavodoxin-dependent (E)-4-hydroxy-3-methylbut-2-enyl-diphosphate synthase [Phycisphaerales bacterium]|nr:MAG: flavodoxin-dependent (E)-4-hydroxy-3-methylbut-2-enyl-diphosphate synthase [Phycisphaerales bacterium]
MVKRRKTLTVTVGSVKIGSSAPIVIQSMTKVPTVDIARCVRQIRRLAGAGCALVRVAVPRRADTAALAAIVPKAGIPLIADVHFSPARAIEAIEAGAAKIRMNPGNIKNRKDILPIIDAAKMHKAAVRIGVNEASIRDLGRQDVPLSKRTAMMLREMKRYVRIFENRGFNQLVLSAKSSDTVRTIEINRSIAVAFDYPIHIGLTHAGLPEEAQIPSAIALGTLLAEGIGDTIRVSLAGNPVLEAKMAKRILQPLGLAKRSTPELIVCPTCARAELDVVKLARRIQKALRDVGKPVRIAVMGCVVNGPGEAADADLAVCTAKKKAYFYRKGRRIAVVPEVEIIPRILQQLQRL